MRFSLRFSLLAAVVVPTIATTESTDISSVFLRGAQPHHRHLNYQCNPYSLCLHRDQGAKCIAWDPDRTVGNLANALEYGLFVDSCDRNDDHQEFILSGGYLRSRSSACNNCCVGLESGQDSDDWGNDFRYLSLHQTCTSDHAGWQYDAGRPCFTKREGSYTKCLHWGGYNVGIQECKTNYDLHQCWLPGDGVV